MRPFGAWTIGRVESSIGELLRSDPRVFARFPHVLVTSLDSSQHTAEIARRHGMPAPWSRLGTAIVLPGDGLATAMCTLLTGFDELWCFEEPPVLEKPAEVTLVGPTDLAKSDPAEDLLRWMSASRCKLGLGDGMGLNVIAANADIAAAIGG